MSIDEAVLKLVQFSKENGKLKFDKFFPIFQSYLNVLADECSVAADKLCWEFFEYISKNNIRFTTE